MIFSHFKADLDILEEGSVDIRGELCLEKTQNTSDPPNLHRQFQTLPHSSVYPSPQDVNVDVDGVEPEGSALDAGGVGGLVEDPRELKVPGDVVGEGEDHGERDETSLQLVELPRMEGGKRKLIRIPNKGLRFVLQGVS